MQNFPLICHLSFYYILLLVSYVIVRYYCDELLYIWILSTETLGWFWVRRWIQKLLVLWDVWINSWAKRFCCIIHSKFLCSVMIPYLNVLPGSYVILYFLQNSAQVLLYLKERSSLILILTHHSPFPILSSFSFPFFPPQQSWFDITHILLIYVISFVLSLVCW